MFLIAMVIVILLVEADKLTREAQQALRRTMEKYIASCRLILCCQSTSRVLPAIRSRCLAIRVAAPTIDEVFLDRSRRHRDVLFNLDQSSVNTRGKNGRSCATERLSEAHRRKKPKKSSTSSPDVADLCCTEVPEERVQLYG